MKKFFAVAALVTLAACSGEKPAPATPAADSVTVAPAADSAAATTDSTAPAADSTMARDTAKTM